MQKRVSLLYRALNNSCRADTATHKQALQHAAIRETHDARYSPIGTTTEHPAGASLRFAAVCYSSYRHGLTSAHHPFKVFGQIAHFRQHRLLGIQIKCVPWF